jgi:putative endonuclease
MTGLIGLIRGLIHRDDSVWKRGEDAAAKHMKSNGYRILDQNLRLGMGEIDLLCEEPGTGTIVVVEVKARLRKSDDQRRVDPEANITAAKKRKLRTLTAVLIKQRPFQNRPIRIDVIAVEFLEGFNKPAELRHYQSAV